MERTIEALRIAGTNAANARADADAAEACAASMVSQLQALRDVVDETKRASSILFKEHEQVSGAARSMEAKLLQKETELARSQKEQRQWMEEREEMKKSAARLQAEQKCLEKETNLLENELHKMKHEAEEYHAVEQARKNRSTIVEKEVRDARTMLVEATAMTAEAESTCAVLKDTISGLETENKTFHETIEKIQDKAREDHARLNDALTKVEKEAQSLRVKAASHEENIERIRMDRSASEKQVTQLKQKVVTLERRLKEATSFVPPSPDKETPRDGESRRGVSFSIPPLATTNTPAKSKENKSNRVTPSAPKSTACCICAQLASGFMKSCQCGKPTCEKRAHATCLASSKLTLPSVSHPGTPAPRVPVLLCGTVRK
jgi:chromosome segregation ATPase